MRGKIAKQLRKKAYEISENKQSEIEHIVHKKKIHEVIYDFITWKYKPDSLIMTYRKLKKKWNSTPKKNRNIDAIKI